MKKLDLIKTGKEKMVLTQKSTYKYVNQFFLPRKGLVWQAAICTYKWSKCYATEREAAIGVDMKLIAAGKAPVNILNQRV